MKKEIFILFVLLSIISGVIIAGTYMTYVQKVPYQKNNEYSRTFHFFSGDESEKNELSVDDEEENELSDIIDDDENKAQPLKIQFMLGSGTVRVRTREDFRKYFLERIIPISMKNKEIITANRIINTIVSFL